MRRTVGAIAITIIGCTPQKDSEAQGACVRALQQACVQASQDPLSTTCLGAVGGGTSPYIERVETLCSKLYPVTP